MQVRIFLEYKPSNVHIDEEEKNLLNQFGDFMDGLGKRDVSQITDEDIILFGNKLCDAFKMTYGYFNLRAVVIRKFLRFYYFHRKEPKRRAGRPADENAIKQVRELIDAGYSYREVQRKTRRNLSRIHAMYHYKPPQAHDLGKRDD